MYSLKISIFILIIGSCLGCEKKPQKPTCVGGTGGNITLVASPKHHGKLVRPYKAYVKFNSKDAPASLSDYDVNKTADTSKDNIKVEGLKCGDYYIYLTGFDTGVNANVKGGIPYTLNETATGEIDVDIPVTE